MIEEPSASIAHARICGRPGRAIARSTRPLSQGRAMLTGRSCLIISKPTLPHWPAGKACLAVANGGERVVKQAVKGGQGGRYRPGQSSPAPRKGMPVIKNRSGGEIGKTWGSGSRTQVTQKKCIEFIESQVMSCHSRAIIRRWWVPCM